jgi:hypothetical protein
MHRLRPEIFANLADILLLESGRQVYFGKAAEALQYVEALGHKFPSNCNPADALLDLISSEEKQISSKPEDSSGRPFPCTQDIKPSTMGDLPYC